MGSFVKVRCMSGEKNDGFLDSRVVSFDALRSRLGQADLVVLTCPLTAETTNLVDATALALMKPGAWLVNVARGACVDEPALIAALEGGTIGGAALDCVQEEPLAAGSPLWTLPNVILTPHSAGETSRYEAKLARLLADNLLRLSAGRSLINQIA